jgi:hypothetical protein
MPCSSTCSLGMMGNLAPQGIGPLCAPARFVGKADKPLIKLQKASQDGEEVGVAFTHTDQILSIRGEKNVTEIRFTDGHGQFAENIPEEVVALAKYPTKKEQVSVLGTGSLLKDATLGDLVFKLPNTVRKAIGSSL